MVTKKARQSRAASSKAAPRKSTSAKATSGTARGGTDTATGVPPATDTQSKRPTSTKGTSAASNRSRPVTSPGSQARSTSPKKTKTPVSRPPTRSPGTKAPARTSKSAPRAPAPSADETFEDVPVEPVRRRRRTVATPTGRRRIKTHRPAPHASSPKSVDETQQAADEASDLAELPTQTARAGTAREGRTLPIEIDPERIEQSLRKLAGELSTWARRGRYTKVRFRFRGKPLLPDLPLAAVVAAEGLTFYWGGILRALLMNVAGGSLLDVELIHDAEKEIQSGKEALLSGDLDTALAHYRRAVAMQPEGAQAHLNLGVALKLRGEREEASTALKRAQELDPEGPVGAEAKRLLERL
ncbi:MAG TPA: tetratricopeptide repeat protein [Myxococcaceae bacterium]|nr:tetratricopeptide repeat protein [Myxococcaceae bacterium]